MESANTMIDADPRPQGDTESDLKPTPSRPSDVAIVGMSAIMPGAGDVRMFWENTLRGFNAIVEIPGDRWDWRTYYDANPKAPDKIVSKWGGFVPDVPFDPLSHGMPPSSLPSIEPVQLLLLEATRSAIQDAGYGDRPFDRERTAVVLGMGGGAAQVAMGYAFRSYLPMLDAVSDGAGRDALKACEGLLPEWTEDSFPGFLLNVAAGRLANRFDLGGANYTVDAACGSSLAAAMLAVRELETGSADVVILGGADTVQNPFTYLAFSKTQAFSPRGRCRPFDASADGIVISEGVAVLVLKRLADAERDGDRVYAVIKGIGASSDGRAKGLTAPSPLGQVRAVERAYVKSGISAATVGYVEAHGTGTAVGDVVEVNAISGVFRDHGAARASTTIGSVKSMIGHAKCAAGLAGLINASLALHHGVLPPTIGVETVNPKLDLVDGPFRVNGRALPWFNGDGPRRAGVSAFGFGGTNFHAVLEAHASRPATPTLSEWPAELFVWRGVDRSGLLGQVEALVMAIDQGARPTLRDLSRAVNARQTPADRPTLAVVARSLDDLKSKLSDSAARIRSGELGFEDARGFLFADSPAFHGQPIAFLFPGQGSQAPAMLADLAMAFGEVRDGFEAFDRTLSRLGRESVGPIVFRRSLIDPSILRSTEVAQPAIGAASVGLLRLLSHLGIEPDVVAGHSYGELLALHAAGSLSIEGLAELSSDRGRLMRAAIDDEPGSMVAIQAGSAEVGRLIEGLHGVTVVNENGPAQTVIAGPVDSVAAAIDRASRASLGCRMLDVAGAFHTKMMASAVGPLTQAARSRITSIPDRPVYSNLDARPHPADLGSIASRIGEHAASPVRFASMVGAMHDDGARVFVEVGPGSVLTSLVGPILIGRTHLAVACDSRSKPGVPGLLLMLARLAVAGVDLKLDRLTEGRCGDRINLDQLPVGDGSPPLSGTTWMVNGSRSRPIDGPEPRRLGQAGLSPVTKPIEAPVNRNGSTNGHHQAAPSGIGKLMSSPLVTPPVAPAASTDERVLAQFQETMRAFLEVQKSTMLAYLGARSVASSPAPLPVVRPSPVPEAIARRIAPSVPSVAPEPKRPEPVVIVESPQAEPTSDVAFRLLEIVRDRTGYPAEMLGLGLDLEADLGIDSIKRVEILGSLRDALPVLRDSCDPAIMDSLSRARTLGAIVDRVGEIARQTEPPPLPEMVSARVEASVIRRRIEAVEAPLSRDRSGLAAGGVVLVTGDGRGVARAIADELESMGHPIVLVGSEVDLTSPSAVDRLLDETRSRGDLAAVVHTLPLRESSHPGLDASAWSNRIGPEIKGLFLIAKAAAVDLERASRGGGGALIAATSMGGAFGSVGSNGDFFPGHGGVTGLVKTLAREWPGVRVRAIDLDPRRPVAELADRLLTETMTDDGWTEVGYLDSRRIRLKAIDAPLLLGGPARIELSPGEPVIVTGGARGITSTLVAELARQWRPTLLLLGRSPLPPKLEDPETAMIDSATELKAVLHARLRETGEPVTPAELDRAYRSLRNAREIRSNLEAMRSAGSVVEYGQVDVRDASALAAKLDHWRGRFGDPVGLIHGAGVIKDKRVRDKTPELFDHVLGTKLDGALNLARLLKAEPIRFAALFSSIAGRFGNLGQSDYAAANEVLNKLALWLDRRWPGRVVSMIWGPWSGVGIGADLEGHLSGQGLGMVTPETGRSLLLDELRFGIKGEVEVIASGNLGTLDQPVGYQAVTGAGR